jgi:hypothetical protein
MGIQMHRIALICLLGLAPAVLQAGPACSKNNYEVKVQPKKFKPSRHQVNNAVVFHNTTEARWHLMPLGDDDLVNLAVGPAAKHLKLGIPPGGEVRLAFQYLFSRGYQARVLLIDSKERTRATLLVAHDQDRATITLVGNEFRQTPTGQREREVECHLADRLVTIHPDEAR